MKRNKEEGAALTCLCALVSFPHEGQRLISLLYLTAVESFEYVKSSEMFLKHAEFVAKCNMAFST